MAFRKISRLFGLDKQRRLEKFKDVLKTAISKGEIEDRRVLDNLQRELKLNDDALDRIKA